MTNGPLRDGLRRLGRATAAGVSDIDLLDRFARDRDEAAFELLVWRHAGMVLGTCRRLLGNPHDAEDAAQACFLVLARRAGAVGRRGSVGGWLHRVARRAALRARAARARRVAGRRPLDEELPAGESGPAAAAEWREARRVLDEEVDRLPDRYRAPFVLCCLEGRANADAARALGCPVGTVESRLARARDRLRAALARRGVDVPAGLLAAVAANQLAVPPALAATAARAAALARAGAPAAGLVSPHVLTLTDGVIRSMWLAKLKNAAALALAAAVVGTGTGFLWQQPAVADPAGSGPPAKADDAARLAALVGRIGAEGFADRERAARELEAIGAPALPALREAARAGNPEQRKRAEDLAGRIEARAATAMLLAAKRVRLTYRDTPVAEAVADLRTRTGYDFSLADPTGALKGRRVTLDTGEVPFWRAVGLFCEAAGLIEAPAAPRPPAGGAAVVGGRGGIGGGGIGGPAAAVASPFADPVRVVLTDGKRAAGPTDDRTAVRVRAAGLGDGAPDGETVLRLEVAAEPRLRWQRTVGVDVRTATDDRGQAVEPVRAADPAPAAPGSAAFAHPVAVRLKTGTRPPAALRELSGTVALQVLTEPEAYVTADGLADAGGKAFQAADGGAVRVVGVAAEAGGRMQVKFGIDLPAGGPAAGLFHLTMRGDRAVLAAGPGPGPEYEVGLADADGVALPLAGAGVRVAGGGAEYALTTRPGAAPARLVCRVSKSVTIDVPFTLRDVPLK